MVAELPIVDSTRGSSGGRMTSWAILALAFGTLLFVLRSAFLLLGFGRIPPAAFELELWHVALSTGRTLPWALAAAALAAGAATIVRPALATAIAAALFAAVLSGWPFDGPGDLPDPSSGAGRISIAILALTAFVLAALLVLAWRRLERERVRANAAPGRFLALPGALVLSAAVPIALWLAVGREPPHRLVRETSREILLDPAAWTVVSSLPDAPPRVGMLTPSLDWSIDGGDVATLVMPPPCEVRFTVGPDQGPAFLRASAGVDHKIAWQLRDAPEDCAVEFAIEVNGERRFGARIPGPDPGSRHSWHHAGGRNGIPVAPGDTIALRTSLTHPDAPIFGKVPLLAGFARLELERAVDRPYRRANPEDPNVLLIVMDTLRADELSCYGETGHATPALDALARRGILYERGYATSSWTWPSTASILTGLPPEGHGVLDDDACYLDGDLDTLAEVLCDRDLSTGAFVCNPILDPGKNFDQGFETYDYSRDFRMSGAVTEPVETWIDQHQDVRFFLYLHLVDPHHPVLARPEDFARLGLSNTPPPGSPEQPLIEYAQRLFEGESIVEGRTDPDPIVPADQQRWIRGAYSASVLSADHYVGEILRALEERGLDENTIVVFTSDHGEELFDHGMLGHGMTLYQELVRVPLIIAGPGVARGARVEAPVTNQDLFSTLARRCGARVQSGPGAVDLLAPGVVEPRPIFFTTQKGWWWNAPRSPMHGVLAWPWVLHVAPQGLAWGLPAGTDPGEGQVRLFDLESDPEERVDRSADRADLAAAMRARLAEHAVSSARIRSERALTRAGAGEGTLELLRRIGYTGDGK